MAAEVLHRLDRICSISNFNLVGFHDFLDRLSNIAKSHINTCGLDSFLGRLFDGLEQWVKHGIKRHSKRTINNMTINLRSKIDLHDIVVFQDCVVSWVWRVVSGAFVNAAAGWESDALLYSICLYQPSIGFLNSLANIDKFHAWSHVRLRHLTHLSMAFGGFSEVINF